MDLFCGSDLGCYCPVKNIRRVEGGVWLGIMRLGCSVRGIQGRDSGENIINMDEEEIELCLALTIRMAW